MKTPKFLDRRLGFSVGALGLLLSMLVPAVVPAFASADQLTSRSISMSNSSPSSDTDGTDVSYELQFTPVDDTAGVIALVFCSDSPIVEDTTCTAPTGMDVSTASSVSGDSATVDVKGANYIVLKTVDMSSGVDVTIDGITNPSTVGTFYARITTYATAHLTTAEDYANGTASGTITYGNTTNVVDEGGIALSTTDEIGVTAAVRESMTFCVFGDDGSGTGSPKAGCDDTISGGPYAPSLVLGEDQGDGTKALETSALSHGQDWAQISTNAANGAIVYLKSSNACRGLSRDSGTTCDIAAAAGNTVAAGSAYFGVKLGTPASATGATAPTGTITPNSAYDGTYDLLTSGTSSSDANSTGGLAQDVSSTYGGYLFGTTKAPISDQNIPLTFGASISNATPAGLYKANLNLIAVGTF